jgi:hypothetical protein
VEKRGADRIDSAAVSHRPVRTTAGADPACPATRPRRPSAAGGTEAAAYPAHAGGRPPPASRGCGPRHGRCRAGSVCGLTSGCTAVGRVDEVDETVPCPQAGPLARQRPASVHAAGTTRSGRGITAGPRCSPTDPTCGDPTATDGRTQFAAGGEECSDGWRCAGLALAAGESRPAASRARAWQGGGSVTPIRLRRLRVPDGRGADRWLRRRDR